MFIFAAGGTGGHIIPALAVAEALEKHIPAAQIVFVGVGTQIEQKLVQPRYTLETIPYVPVLGKGPGGWWSALTDFNPALREAMALYRRSKPDAVIGFGGYPAVIPIIAARMSNVPRILHEQNAQVGLANKFLSLLVDELYAVHRAQGFWSKSEVVHLSNPVRQDFLRIPDWQRPASGTYTILVVGGSQGAVAVNDAVLKQIPLFKRLGVKVMHIAGWKDYDRVLKTYAQEGFDDASVHAFVDDLAPAYAKAHLVVCRAGAMTAAEVSAAGRPAIYIPLVIAGAHQAENVKHLVSQDAAEALSQGPDLADRLGQTLELLLDNPQRLARMGHNARALSQDSELGQSSAERLAQALLKYSEQRRD